MMSLRVSLLASGREQGRFTHSHEWGYVRMKWSALLAWAVVCKEERESHLRLELHRECENVLHAAAEASSGHTRAHVAEGGEGWDARYAEVILDHVRR